MNTLTPTEILEKATEKATATIAKGGKLSFEATLKMYIKMYTKQQPRKMTSKDISKMETRNRVDRDVQKIIDSGVAIDYSDYYEAASMRQRGSSMR